MITSIKLPNDLIEIFNTLGKLVQTLINEKQSVGNYEVIFDAVGFSSGVYFYQLKTDEIILFKKMSLVR